MTVVVEKQKPTVKIYRLFSRLAFNFFGAIFFISLIYRSLEYYFLSAIVKLLSKDHLGAVFMNALEAESQ